MNSISKKKNELIKGTIIYAIGSFGSKILSLLIVPLYTFYIMPEDLGYYDIILTTIGLLTPLVTLQITDAAYKKIVDDYIEKQKYISITYIVLFVSSLFITFIILVFGEQIAPINYRIYLVFMLIAQMWFYSIQRLLRAVKKQKLFVTAGILQSIVFLALIIFLVCVANFGVDGLCISYIAAHILASIFILIKSPELVLKKFYFSRIELRHMLCFSVPLIPNAMSWWLINSSQKYLILFFLGGASNGIYSVTSKFPTIMQTINSLFYSSWQDVAIREKAGKERNDFFSSVFENYYKFSFGIVLFLIPMTKMIMPFIVDEAYSSAGNYTTFLYLGMIFQGFSSFFGINYLTENKTIGATYTSILAAIINVIVDIILLPHIGLYAAEISTFIGFFIMWLIRVKQTSKYTKTTINKRLFLSLFTACFAMALICIFTSTIMECVLSVVGLCTFMIVNRDMVRNMFNKLLEKINLKLDK